ncbi:hypothetical protein J3E73DRAFT_392408 [Bipolaris maydis]|nr:hypothetical protein J3E73DRAFT_392408 [Bipolaris maydis]
MAHISKTKKVPNAKNKIGYHDDKLKQLEDEHKKLQEAMNQAMSTEEDKEKMKKIETEMGKYANVAAQVNIKAPPGPGSGSTNSMDGEAMETDTKSNEAEPLAREETSSTKTVATQPSITTHVLDPKKTFTSNQERSSGYRKTKQEPSEESKSFTHKLVDSLNIKWDVDVNNSHGESSLQHLPKEVFGHIIKGSRTRYCVQYRSNEGLSARFKSILPNGSNYKEERDVTQGSNRIVEKIVQHHRDNKTALPINILSQVKVLAEVKQKSIALYNIAVKIKNQFEKRWMSNIPGRPGPLRKLKHKRKAVSRLTKSPCATTEHSVSPTLMKPPVPHQRTPIKKKAGISLKEQFHKDFLELFELLEDATYTDLTKEQQLLYPAQFTKWKKLYNMNIRYIIFINVFTLTTRAFWRLPCYSRLGVFRIDPIVSEGLPSQYAHTLHGAQNLNFSSSYDSLVHSKCTTCAVLEDMSASWTPPLMFSHTNGTVEIVPQVGGMLIYYFLFGDEIKAFPPGFRMIAGNASKQNDFIPPLYVPQSLWGPEEKTPKALTEKAIGFNCLNYSGAAEGSLTRHLLPNKSFIDSNCADGLRLELMFPSCWNGISLDANDHKSHVAYPDLVMEGTCSTGYQTRIPALFFETIWDTSVFRNVSGRFLLSNSDQAGSSYHGDFQNGWNIATLQQAIGSCTNLSGVIEDCTVFSLQSLSQAGQCHLLPPATVANESCVGPRLGLCGNVSF